MLSGLRLRPPRNTRAVPGVRYNPRPVRRLGRILLNALTALSLILFVAVVALWVRSYWVSDDVTRESADGEGFWSWSFAHAGRGRLLLVRHTIAYSSGGNRHPAGLRWDRKAGPPSADWPMIAAGAGSDVVGWQFAGFGHRWRDEQKLYGADRCDWVTLPIWFAAAVTGAVSAPGSAAHARRRRRRWRERRGLCPTCGYDLRATPDRCPECGMMASKVSAPGAYSSRTRRFRRSG
jgi:hypothetical protein